MTKKELYDILKERFQEVLKEHQIENDHLSVSCRSLTPEEAIGKTKRTDYPILTGKDDRGIFIATVNAVMASLGLCCGTVHCRTEGPELCAQDMLNYLEINYPDVKRIALVGFQPSLLEMLSKSKYDVRVMDLNPNNIGQLKFGIRVEGGTAMKEEIRDSYAELILCTGSTLCNGSIIDYLDLDKDVLFFGTTASGAAPLLGLKRVCFADKYE